jgi:hypothetical protein
MAAVEPIRTRGGSRNLSQDGHLLISISTEIICIYLYTYSLMNNIFIKNNVKS